MICIFLISVARIFDTRLPTMKSPWGSVSGELPAPEQTAFAVSVGLEMLMAGDR